MPSCKIMWCDINDISILSTRAHSQELVMRTYSGLVQKHGNYRIYCLNPLYVRISQRSLATSVICIGRHTTWFFFRLSGCYFLHAISLTHWHCTSLCIWLQVASEGSLCARQALIWTNMLILCPGPLRWWCKLARFHCRITLRYFYGFHGSHVDLFGIAQRSFGDGFSFRFFNLQLSGLRHNFDNFGHRACHVPNCTLQVFSKVWHPLTGRYRTVLASIAPSWRTTTGIGAWLGALVMVLIYVLGSIVVRCTIG